MDNTTNTLAEQSKLRRLVNSYGVPRLIITGFLLLMFILAPVAGVDFATQITNVINRFSWNAIMVLAMVPMIHSGCGLNFGLPLGVSPVCWVQLFPIEFGFTGGMSFLMAIVIATPFALVLGGGYGWMLNKIKGGEMMVATYVGFSSVSIHVHDVAAAALQEPQRWFGALPVRVCVPPSLWRASTISSLQSSCRST